MDQRRRMLLVAPALLAGVLGACAGQPGKDGRTTETEGHPAASVGPVIERGAELYRAHCETCHGDSDGRGGRPGAPPHHAPGHTWHHPDAHLKEWILRGKPPGRMPGFSDKLTEQEVEGIIAFIKTLWTPEQREAQADVSRRYEEALERQRR